MKSWNMIPSKTESIPKMKRSYTRSKIPLFLIQAFRKLHHVRTGRSWVSHTTDWESAWRWQDSQDLAQRILPSSSIVQTAQLVDAGMIVLKIWSLLSFSVLGENPVDVLELLSIIEVNKLFESKCSFVISIVFAPP